MKEGEFIEQGASINQMDVVFLNTSTSQQEPITFAINWLIHMTNVGAHQMSETETLQHGLRTITSALSIMT